MRATSKFLALALTAALQPAFAGMVSLDFEGLSSVEKLAQQYDSTLGITFTGSAWGIKSKYDGCTGTAAFVGDGSCGALELALSPTAAAGTGSSSFTLSFAGGFIDELAFDYSARANANVLIQLYSGVDGTGDLLRTLRGLNGANCSINNVRFCVWDTTSIKFAGTALSVKFTGIDQSLLLDNLKFTTAAVGPTVPEPASLALAVAALGALGWARKRAAR